MLLSLLIALEAPRLQAPCDMGAGARHWPAVRSPADVARCSGAAVSEAELLSTYVVETLTGLFPALGERALQAQLVDLHKCQLLSRRGQCAQHITPNFVSHLGLLLV